MRTFSSIHFYENFLGHFFFPCWKSEEEYRNGSNKNDCDRVHVYFLQDDESNDVQRDFERQTDETISCDASCLRKFRHNSISSYSNEDTAAKSDDKPSVIKFRHNSISSYLKPDRSSKEEDSLSFRRLVTPHRKR